MNIGKFLGKTVRAVNRNKPTILTWMTVFGVASTAVLSFDAGIKAERILRELPEDATLKDKGMSIIHILIKPAATAGGTIACALGANKEAMKQIGSLTTAWELSKISDQNFEKVVKEKVGEEKFQEIKEELEMPDSDVLMGDESYIPYKSPEDYETPIKCMDDWTGQKFWAKPCQITQARDAIKTQISEEGFASFNEYAQLVPEMEWTDEGDRIGWYSPQDFDVWFSSTVDKYHRPVLVVHFLTPPGSSTDY